MASKGNKRHVSGLAASKYLALHRKEHDYVTKAQAGRHTEARSLALVIAIKKLKYAETTGEATKIIKKGAVRINKKIVREPKYPIGLNDILEFPEIKKAYQIGVNSRAQVTFDELEKADFDSMLYKVVGKYKTTGGVVMVRLHDGSIVNAGKHEIQVSDSVILDSKRAIKKVLHLATGSECKVIDGVHVGKSGMINTIKKGTMNISSSAIIKPKSGDEFETIIKNIMIVS